ncbi:hypothetical protein Pedsa_1994 [Pseudopedobacter saltans DSM 12145]|uniref:Uncharacterized protein n=1 Tax=Pseudopedobacter saltans (strain ATCC 51119 / DSM 12145 / JCM 21818 / CCUG 39354 / LMG 10337 / NBRC 100064 / NCIMB 13643) TaxID=762903 RepID=F0S9Y9_PSESL|nr:hypothetical protein Pedsa_1994 [Pseudopedobacter saltans DSM 12145]
MKYRSLLVLTLMVLAIFICSCSESKQQQTAVKNDKVQSKATVSKELAKKPACCQANIPSRF